MATATLPTIQGSGGSSLDTLLAGITRNLTREGGQESMPGFTDELGILLNQLIGDTGPFSRQAAISDVQGQVSQLAQRSLQQFMPALASQQRQSGLYNSSTRTLLENDLNSRLAGEMAALVSKQIADYAQISNQRVAAGAQASNAARTSRPTNSGGLGGKGSLAALSGPLAGLLLGEGKKALGSLFADTAKDTTKDLAGMDSLIGSLTNTASNVASGIDVSGFIDQFGDFSSPQEFVPDIAGGITSDIPLPDITDIFGAGGFDPSAFFGSIGDFFGGIGSSIGDLFGGLFEDGGKVPMKKAPGYKDGGEIQGPKSKSGRDNMIIAVQGGEGIIPRDVMEVPGVEQLLDMLIEQHHTPRAGGK